MWWSNFHKKEKIVLIGLTGVLALTGIVGIYTRNDLITAIGLFPLAAELGYLVGITIVDLIERR